MSGLRCVVFAIVWCCCSAKILNKCCPEDEGILKVNKTGFLEYRCIKALVNNGTVLHNETLHPLLVGTKNSSFVHGFPPDCAFTVHNYLQNELIPTKHCIDKVFGIELLNGTVIIGRGHVKVIGCDVERIEKPSMTTIRKCCLDKMVYDTEYNVCVHKPAIDISDIKHPPNKELFKEFVGEESELLNIKFGSPYCPPSKAIYSYVDSLYGIILINDTLVLNRSSHNEKFELESRSFCVDETHKGIMVARACRNYYSGTPRVFKCCPEGYIYGMKNCSGMPRCVPNSDWGINFDFYDLSNMNNITQVPQPDVIGISYTIDCDKKFALDKPEEVHYLDKDNGDLIAPKYKILRPKYCMDMLKVGCGDNKPEPFTLSCLPDLVDIEKIRKKLIVYSVGLVISSIFLALTLIVYIALPPLRNLHGKTIMCHVASMLVAFSCLARVQWSMVESGYCKILGYIIYFSFLSAFSWLNVMCFDIWWTFANIRTMQTMQQNKDLIRFLRYSLYAWGVPILLTITAFLFDEFDVAPTWLDPNIGEPQCWINTSSYKAPLLIMFTLPVALQITANSVFFILTAVYCNKVKSEIHRLQAGSMGERCRRRFTADKAKYVMNLKLFIVMGISWILEIISVLISDPIEIWYFTDAINVLQGIPIFCILILKRKIFHLVKRRLGSKNKRKRPSLEDPQLLSCLDKVQLRPRSDITMTTGISSSSSDGRKSLPWRKSEKGTNGLLVKENP